VVIKITGLAAGLVSARTRLDEIASEEEEEVRSAVHALCWTPAPMGIPYPSVCTKQQYNRHVQQAVERGVGGGEERVCARSSGLPLPP
jgi:hypothetical protein